MDSSITMRQHIEIAIQKKENRRLFEDNKALERAGNEQIKQLQAEVKNWKQKYQEAVNDLASLKGKIATHYRPKGK